MSGGEDAIRTILVVGGGTAGLIAAAVLARSLPPQLCSVALLDSPVAAGGLEGLNGGVATLSPIAAVHEQIGIAEVDLLRHADATFSLGASFADFGKTGSSYFRTFGRYGAAENGVAFHNLWEMLRRKGLGAALEEHSLAAVMARLGRFMPSSGAPNTLSSSYDHGLHLDGAAYRAVLQVAAREAGVARIEGALGGVEMRADGMIAAVTLADGRRIVADLYLDCTGDGALIDRLEPGDWEDWSHWLPCDRVLAGRSARAGDPPPVWQARAHGAGWGWHIPLQSGDGRGHVYASAYQSDEQAEAALGGVSGLTRARFASGRRRRPWRGNVIAIGASACVIDPLEPTAIQIVQDGIGTLLSLLPRKGCDAGEADEFNRLMGETADRMRDFVILHYRATARGEPFWEARRATALPDRLEHKLRLFEASGRVIEWDEETFFDADWVAVYLGQGVRPRGYDPLADAIEPKALRARMADMRKLIVEAAGDMPTHRAFIDAQLRG
jgi:tryptophan halogenase